VENEWKGGDEAVLPMGTKRNHRVDKIYKIYLSVDIVGTCK